MRLCYSNIETDVRGYVGWEFEPDESKELLSLNVKSSLLDEEEQISFLDDLAGLPLTGFDGTRILADIQAIESEYPADLRTWRIGEAFAEVALSNQIGVRFHWNELRDARNPRGNKTGADLVGFIEVNGDVLFLFGEAKTSSEIRNRPPQVMTGAGQMEAQLKELHNNKEKRMVLIRYLASKTRNLSDTHQFKLDYREALKCYYRQDQINYQLIGVLIRDVDQHEDDLRTSFTRLKDEILDPAGIKLVACYIPLNKNTWKELVKGQAS